MVSFGQCPLPLRWAGHVQYVCSALPVSSDLIEAVAFPEGSGGSLAPTGTLWLQKGPGPPSL